MQLTSQQYIDSTAEVRSGKPRIAGTRIAVEDVAVMHLTLGYSLVEIAGQYELSMASVYAAMAYYFDHREEIDIRAEQENEQVQVLRKNYPSRLQEKLQRLRNE
jgi:uncharacterized protein (DUF433 family)